MRSLATFGPCLVLTVLLVLPGCAKDASAPTSGASSVAVGSSESEVKSVPVGAPPAAAPPYLPPGETGPEALAHAPLRPAAPSEETKQTLEPKSAQTAALAPPKSAAPAKPARPTPTPPAQPEPQAQDQTAKAQRTGHPAIAVVGDSLAVGIGMTMEQRLHNHSEGIGCIPLGKVSTGLISKKKLDWEKRLSELVATEKLAAVVVMMGGNDANNSLSGKPAGTPEWGEAYRRKAESFLRIAGRAGIRVFWVGLPAMRDPAYGARVQAVNDAAKAACSSVSGCTYLPPSDIFTDASGHFVESKAINGKTVPLRGHDGVHMTMTGYALLCGQVLDTLARSGALPSKN